MPRRNENHIGDRAGRRGGGRKSRSRSQQIDWTGAARAHYGREPEDSTTAHRREKVRNEYTRILTGFSERALELMFKFGFDNVDENGLVVGFSGVSQAPRKEIGVKKPAVTRGKGGILVLTGIVEAININEIGKGSVPIRQTTPLPTLDGFDAASRFNVTLGREHPLYDTQDLHRAVSAGGAILTLSAVSSINGNAVHAHSDLSQMWRKQQPSGSAW